MTDTNEAVITEALSVIDKALAADAAPRTGVVRRSHRRPARRPHVADVAGTVAARLIPSTPTIRSANARSRQFTEQFWFRHRCGVDVHAHVEAVVVAQHREVERHAGQRADRIVLEDLCTGDVERHRRTAHVAGREVDRLGLLTRQAGDQRRRQGRCHGGECFERRRRVGAPGPRRRLPGSRRSARRSACRRSAPAFAPARTRWSPDPSLRVLMAMLARSSSTGEPMRS